MPFESPIEYPDFNEPQRRDDWEARRKRKRASPFIAISKGE